MLKYLQQLLLNKKYSYYERKTYTPVILFVYNRYEHTKKTLQALKNNILAEKTELYIYSDGPRSKTDTTAINLVRKLCLSVKGFAKIKLYESTINKGLAESIINGVTEQLNIHDRVIVLEDDLVTSAKFLLYMNNALDYYENDPFAFSIGGYTFPPHADFKIPVKYAWDTYIINRCCTWGWATWRSRWQKIVWDKEYFTDFLQDSSAQESFNLSGTDRTNMLRQYCDGKMDVWGIRFCYAHFINRMNCIYPVRSLVNNIGLDSSGVHCGVDHRRQHKKLDNNWLPQRFCPAGEVDPEILFQFSKMF